VKGRYREICLDDDTTVAAHAVLLSTGVTFRWLQAPGCPDLVGRGVYYGAGRTESLATRGKDLFLVGGGNSAGQRRWLAAPPALHPSIGRANYLRVTSRLIRHYLAGNQEDGGMPQATAMAESPNRWRETA
jgi:hypothetical protein